jgi:hypothetical protein
MISKWLSAQDLATILTITERGVRKRAKNEHWPSHNQKANGGIRKMYQLAALPEDVQRAYAENLAISLEEMQSHLKPASIPEKKVVLANHTTRSGAQADLPSLEKASDQKRRTAKLRAKVIHAWDESGWDVYKFVAEYNAGHIASDLREALGGKTIGKSTLYNWAKKYQINDEAGLVPQ